MTSSNLDIVLKHEFSGRNAQEEGKIMKSNQRFSRSLIAVTVVVAGLMTAGTIPRAQADEQIIPVNANAYGNAYGGVERQMVAMVALNSYGH